LSTLFAFATGAAISTMICGVLLLIERERLHSRLARAERDRRFLSLAENVGSVATWIVDNRTGKVTWSDRVFDIHGRDKAAGPPDIADAIDYYHPDDRERVQDTINKALETGSPFLLDARIIDEQGVEKSVVSRGICNVGHDGSVEEVFGVFFEISASRSFAVSGTEDLNTLALQHDCHVPA